jgi:hypothetical protein
MRQAILCRFVEAIAALGCVSVASAAFIVSDGTFNDSDWQLTYDGPGAGSVAYQVNSGGSPGEYRRIVNAVPPPGTQITTFHRRLGLPYDPQAQGAIASLDYSEDALNEGWGQGQGAAPAIFQNGAVYGGPYFYTPETSWVQHSFSDLTAQSFWKWAGPGNEHPDFSATASPLEFGFLRANSQPGFRGISAGIDNWTFAITPVPEPAALLLLVFGGQVIRRRR